MERQPKKAGLTYNLVPEKAVAVLYVYVCVCVTCTCVCVWCFIAYKVLALTLETFLQWSNFMRQYWEYGYPSLKEEERCLSLQRLSYLPKATW